MKIELLSQWKLEAESRNSIFYRGKAANMGGWVPVGGEITNSLGNIYSQDVPTGRPGTSLYDVLQSFLIVLTEYTGL